LTKSVGSAGGLGRQSRRGEKKIGQVRLQSRGGESGDKGGRLKEQVLTTILSRDTEKKPDGTRGSFEGPATTLSAGAEGTRWWDRSGG